MHASPKTKLVIISGKHMVQDLLDINPNTALLQQDRSAVLASSAADNDANQKLMDKDAGLYSTPAAYPTENIWCNIVTQDQLRHVRDCFEVTEVRTLDEGKKVLAEQLKEKMGLRSEDGKGSRSR